MKINKLNYEAFVIDYVEGNLSADDKTAVDTFLNLHPEIREELTDYLEAPILIEDDNITFDKKEELLRPVSKKLLLSLLFLGLLISVGVILNQFSSSSSAIDSPNYEVPESSEDKSYLPLAEVKAQPVDFQELEKTTNNSAVSQKVKSSNKAPDSKKQTTSTNLVASTKNSISKIIPSKALAVQTIPKTSKIQNTVVDQSLLTKNPESQKEEISSLASAPLIPTLTKDAIASTAQTQLLSQTKVMVIVIDQTQENNENKKWWSVIAPQAYENTNLRQALSSISLKSAARQTDLSILPQRLITK